jgi:hypothetical protein
MRRRASIKGTHGAQNDIVAPKCPPTDGVIMLNDTARFGDILIRSERFRDFIRMLAEAAAHADGSRQQE